MSDGPIVYDEDGNPLRMQIMDDEDNDVEYRGMLEQGMAAFKNGNCSLIVLFEKP